jgi:hypothetical protein
MPIPQAQAFVTRSLIYLDPSLASRFISPPPRTSLSEIASHPQPPSLARSRCSLIRPATRTRQETPCSSWEIAEAVRYIDKGTFPFDPIKRSSFVFYFVQLQTDYHLRRRLRLSFDSSGVLVDGLIITHRQRHHHNRTHLAVPTQTPSQHSTTQPRQTSKKKPKRWST